MSNFYDNQQKGITKFVLDKIIKSFVDDYCLEDRVLEISVLSEDIEYKKFYDRNIVKVSSLGVSQKGYKKYLIRIKDSFTHTVENNILTKQIMFGEGIAFEGSYDISCYKTHTITVKIKIKIDNLLLTELSTKTKSGVYLFRYISPENKPILKIGKSRNVFERYSNAKTTSPDLELIGYIMVEREIDFSRLEKMLHKKFKEHHYKREWFMFHSDILDYFQKNVNFIGI